jgi:hypothetical protein
MAMGRLTRDEARRIALKIRAVARTCCEGRNIKQD